jgi:hypothetical protein
LAGFAVGHKPKYIYKKATLVFEGVRAYRFGAALVMTYMNNGKSKRRVGESGMPWHDD